MNYNFWGSTVTGLTKLMAGVIPCAIMFAAINDGRAEYLTGNDRSDFITGATNSCLRRRDQDTDPFIAQMPRSFFEQICRCYANGLADHYSTIDLKSDDPAVTRPMIQAETKRCYEEIRQKTVEAYCTKAIREQPNLTYEKCRHDLARR